MPGADVLIAFLYHLKYLYFFFQSVSQVKTLDTVFRKNTNFSKPIDEHWDQAKPYELEQIPKL